MTLRRREGSTASVRANAAVVTFRSRSASLSASRAASLPTRRSNRKQSTTVRTGEVMRAGTPSNFRFLDTIGTGRAAEPEQTNPHIGQHRWLCFVRKWRSRPGAGVVYRSHAPGAPKRGRRSRWERGRRRKLSNSVPWALRRQADRGPNLRARQHHPPQAVEACGRGFPAAPVDLDERRRRCRLGEESLH